MIIGLIYSVLQMAKRLKEIATKEGLEVDDVSFKSF